MRQGLARWDDDTQQCWAIPPIRRPTLVQLGCHDYKGKLKASHTDGEKNKKYFQVFSGYFKNY